MGSEAQSENEERGDDGENRWAQVMNWIKTSGMLQCFCLNMSTHR